MKFRFQNFVAYRYLRGAQGSAEGKSFLRFITYVAVGGVTIGVAALLLAFSIVRGFSREIQDKIVGFGGHVQVEHFQDMPLDNAASWRERLAAYDAVESVNPVVLELALLRSVTSIEGVGIWGTEDLRNFLPEQILAGTPGFAADTAGRPGIVIGRKLAGLLNAGVGDRLTAFSMRGLPLGGAGDQSSMPLVRQFYVSAIYETALSNFDELYVFVDIEVARALLDYRPDQVTRFDLTLYDIDRADDLAYEIEMDYGFPILARSIFQVYRNLFAWVNLQQSIIPLVISVIILVAAFNILGTLLMVILEKTGEIGILGSMGASRRSIKRLFVFFGLLIGVIGTVLGQGLALLLGYLQQRFGIIPLPQEAYYMDTAPVEMNPMDFLIVAVATLLLCIISAYIPARVASRIQPVRALRFT